MTDMQHPDITSAHRTGYATFQAQENEDSPEAQWEFVLERWEAFLAWIRAGYPELFEEFIEFGYAYHKTKYREWLTGEEEY